MDQKKVLFINQETEPFTEGTPMSAMGKALPQLIQDMGNEIRTFMPKWGNINERRGQLHEVKRLSGMNVIINDTDHPLIIKVASIPSTRVQVYFIDNDDFFKHRQMEIDELGQPYPDNGERAVFFARGVLETVKKLRWAPDIIYCQGWMGAVVPIYIKKAYNEEPSFANTKVITSLFNSNIYNQLGDNLKQSLLYKDITADMLDKYGEDFNYEELGKMAIDYSDGVILASDKVNEKLINYAKEQKKEILEYPGEDFSEPYTLFFEKILNKE